MRAISFAGMELGVPAAPTGVYKPLGMRASSVLLAGAGLLNRVRTLAASAIELPQQRGQAIQILLARLAKQDQRQFGGDQGVGAGMMTLMYV